MSNKTVNSVNSSVNNESTCIEVGSGIIEPRAASIKLCQQVVLGVSKDSNATYTGFKVRIPNNDPFKVEFVKFMQEFCQWATKCTEYKAIMAPYKQAYTCYNNIVKNNVEVDAEEKALLKMNHDRYVEIAEEAKENVMPVICAGKVNAYLDAHHTSKKACDLYKLLRHINPAFEHPDIESYISKLIGVKESKGAELGKSGLFKPQSKNKYKTMLTYGLISVMIESGQVSAKIWKQVK